MKEWLDVTRVVYCSEFNSLYFTAKWTSLSLEVPFVDDEVNAELQITCTTATSKDRYSIVYCRGLMVTGAWRERDGRDSELHA
jgi:hypothetical protein